MAMELAPVAAAEVPWMVAERPWLPGAAADLLATVPLELRKVWPCDPDEDRVRFYVWASRQVADSRARVERAWSELHEASMLLSYIAEELEAFAATGSLPELDDEDLYGLGSPMAPREAGSNSEIRLPTSYFPYPQEVGSPLPPPTSRTSQEVGGSRRKSGKSDRRWEGSMTVAELASLWGVGRDAARSRLQGMEGRGEALAVRSRLANGGYAPTRWRTES